jgi:hypothetical protein
VAELHRVVEEGFWCYDAFVRDPWLAPIRERSDVRELLEKTRERVIDATRSFRTAHGPELLNASGS